MTSQTNRAITLTAFLLLQVVALAIFVVASQSAISIDIIEVSLQRHAEQYLIERATADLVNSELSVQNLWLWISASVVQACAAFALFRFVRLRVN